MEEVPRIFNRLGLRLQLVSPSWMDLARHGFAETSGGDLAAVLSILSKGHVAIAPRNRVGLRTKTIGRGGRASLRSGLSFSNAISRACGFRKLCPDL